MGHACNAGCSNYFAKLIPDTGVQYTGPAIAALGICTGDYLSEVDAVILQKLIDYSTGVGISITSIDLTTCDAFADCLDCCGTCTDLPCLLNCYKNTICSIFDDLTELKADVAALLDGPYDTGCLTGLATNPTLNQIIQRLILQFCELSAAYNTLQTQVNGITANLSTNIGTFLYNAIGSCQGTGVLNKTGPGASTTFSLKGFVPIGTVMPYAGDMSKFDSSGLGRSGTDACGWAVANGNNGTVNMSGLVPVGTTSGVMGSPVTGGSPSSSQPLSYNSTAGEFNHTLTGLQIPSVSVAGSITDPGHDHPFYFHAEPAQSGNSTQKVNFIGSINAWTGSTSTGLAPSGNGSVGPTTAYIGKATTGITLSGASTGGGGQSHNTMQPYRALYFIQRVS